jgi:hypothetical protein
LTDRKDGYCPTAATEGYNAIRYERRTEELLQVAVFFAAILNIRSKIKF